MIDALLERFRRGDRLALSRLLTLASRGQSIEAIRSGLPRHCSGRVVGVTGPGGVGKSTLTGALISLARRHGRRVAVLACDPRSPLSGGALLGDRFRMPSQMDDHTFIRSLAAEPAGSLASHIDTLIGLMLAFGFDFVLIETVGAGQGDTAIRPLVDVLLLLLQPQTGDDVQWEKAGVMEVADIVVIHKADLPEAERMEAQLRASLMLGHSGTQVVRVSSRTGQGLDDLWRLMEATVPRRETRSDAGRLLHIAQELVAERFGQQKEVIDAWQRGELDDLTAARRILDTECDQRLARQNF